MPIGYFNNFPTVQYPYRGKIVTAENPDSVYVDTVQATDIMLRFQIRKEVLKSPISFYTWRWRTGDRPDTIAQKYYGDSRYAWVVMYSAKLFDAHFDFPLTDSELAENIRKVYTSIPLQSETISGSFYLGETVRQYVGSDVAFEGRLIDFNTTNSGCAVFKTAGELQLGVDLEGEDSGQTVTVSTTFPLEYDLVGLYSIVHHYETSDGYIIDKTTYDTLAPSERKAVTIYDYEISQNERNRNIKLLSKNLLLSFEEGFRQQIKDIEKSRKLSKLEIILGGKQT